MAPSRIFYSAPLNRNTAERCCMQIECLGDSLGDQLCMTYSALSNPSSDFMQFALCKWVQGHTAGNTNIFANAKSPEHFTLDDRKTGAFLFPYNPHPPHPDKPPRLSHRRGLISVRSGSFGSVSGLFRVLFGSVSRCWVGLGWGQGEGLL